MRNQLKGEVIASSIPNEAVGDEALAAVKASDVPIAK